MGLLSEPAVVSVRTAPKINGERVDEIVRFAEGVRKTQIIVKSAVVPLLDISVPGVIRRRTLTYLPRLLSCLRAVMCMWQSTYNESVSSQWRRADLLSVPGADMSIEHKRVSVYIIDTRLAS